MPEGGEVNNREWLYSLDVADLSDWFDAEHVETGTGRGCPGYDADRNYCKYHAQDFELNDATVSRLKRENAKISAERDDWRRWCKNSEEDFNRLQDAYDELIGKCAELCSLCGFSMVDASGEVVG